MKKIIWKTFLVVAILGAVCGLGYLVLQWTGLNSVENLRKVVDNSFWGMFIFFIILVAQVIFLPAGTIFFSGSAVVLFESPLKAWLICWIGLAVGSWLMFWLARLWGTKVLKWIVGSERAEKYAYYVGRGKFVLPLLLLVPIFPDDIICAATGLAKVNWLYFMIVVFITRGIDNFCTVFVGAELIKTVPGMIVLGVFIVLMIIASIFLTKHQEKIEQFFLDLFTRKKKKENEDAGQTQALANEIIEDASNKIENTNKSENERNPAEASENENLDKKE